MKNLNQLARVFVVVILCMTAMATADKGSGARTCFQQTDCVLHGSICCEASQVYLSAFTLSAREFQ